MSKKSPNSIIQTMNVLQVKITLLTALLCISSLLASAQCTEVSVAELTSVLKGLIVPSIGITLDRDNSRVSILGITERFTLPAEDISKAFHDWRYWVQDIRSDDANLWFDDKTCQFVLDVRFEGEGSEIKGVCPGCVAGDRDNRAPDINWEGARIARMRFTPVPYDRSVTIDVASVELFGEFDLNGFLESVFPRMVRNMEARIKRDIQTEAATILNRADIKRNIASNLRPILSAVGISNVRQIRMSSDKRKILFCQ